MKDANPISHAASERDAQNEEKVVVSASGSTRSKQKVDYGLVPPIVTRITAERFTLGAIHHGPHNWERGQPWGVIISHMEAHLNSLKERLWRGERFNPAVHDDDCAAIIWGAGVIAYFERDQSASAEARAIFQGEKG